MIVTIHQAQAFAMSYMEQQRRAAIAQALAAQDDPVPPLAGVVRGDVGPAASPLAPAVKGGWLARLWAALTRGIR